MAPLNEKEQDKAVGDNNLARRSPREQFFAKKFYYENVYKNGSSPWAIRPIDFINENPYYGKVDPDGYYITPLKTMMKVIPESGGLLALNFVVDAYEDLQFAIKQNVSRGKLKKQGYIADIFASKAWVDPQNQFDVNKESNYFLFTKNYLNSSVAQDAVRSKYNPEINIYDFNDFMKYFMYYVDYSLDRIPLTLSGMVAASSYAPASTGLCIEIADLEYDKDEKKQRFINDPNFPLFRTLARYHGFYLDRNVPWRLVADITSYRMREYMRIAYERPLLEKAESDVVTSQEEALREIFYDQTEQWHKSPIADWTAKQINEHKEETTNLINQAKSSVYASTSELWDEKVFQFPKDPITLDPGSPDNNKTRCIKIPSIFELFFERVHYDDIERLKRVFRNYYESYVHAHPIISQVKQVGCVEKGNYKTVVEDIERKEFNEQEFNTKYGDMFWIKMYFDLRLKESKIKLNKKEYKKKIKFMFEMLRVVKKDMAGTTSINSNHAHQFVIDDWHTGDGHALETCHPSYPNVCHQHEIKNWTVVPAGSYMFDFKNGSELHSHLLDNNAIMEYICSETNMAMPKFRKLKYGLYEDYTLKPFEKTSEYDKLVESNQFYVIGQLSASDTAQSQGYK